MAYTSPEPDSERATRTGSALAAACVCVLFVVSGSVGLIYEVAWKHIFTTVFGSTTYAVSVVIAVFMAGLALGSFVFGKLADRTRRHLLIFALLQAGIAVSGLLVPPALHAVEGLYRTLFQWSGSAPLLTTAQVMVSAVILLVPTFLMGGTLPVLSRFMATRKGQVGSAVGLLYGLNTLGAAGGAFLTGFVLIRVLGTLKTIYLAAAANIAVAVVFLALHSLTRAEEAAPTQEEPEGIEETPLGLGRLRLLLLAVAVSGFVSFSYEVLWTRLLSFRLRTTVYAFSVMLATFLLGLGLGGALVGLSRKKRAKADYWRIYGYLEAAIGVCGLCTIFLLLAPRLDWASFVGRTVQQFGMSALIMLVPATLMGAAFPIACHLFASGVSQTGRSVGSMYVVNTIGAVAGALLTGFYLVRALGTQHSLALASFVIIASGSLILVLAPPSASRESSRARPRRSVLVHVILIWAVAIGLWSVTPRGLLPTYYVRHQPQGPERQLLGYHEGLEGVAVASELPDGDRLLSVGATIVAGTAFKLRNTQKLQAHIPMLVHPDPKEVCQVGFGSGETARIFASYDVDRFDCVEISPGVIEMADEHFRDINDGIVHKPNFNAIIMDATVYLKYTDRRYDVIANDATWPHLGGAWALFTLEYFQEGRERLKPDGIMTSWLPLDLPLLDLKSLLKSFHEVFPHVYLWSALSHQNKHALLIGSDHELQIDARQFMNRFDRFARDDLQIVNLDDPAAFLTCHLATMADMGPELAATPLNTQDRPTLQFLTRRLTSSQRMVADAHKLLAPHEDSVMNHLTGAEALPGGERLLSRIRTLQRANEQLLEALAMAMDSPSRVKLALDRAARLAPDHPFFAAVRQMRQELLALSAEQIRKRNVYSLRNLAQQLGREGLYDRALVALKEWERKEPDSADVHERLGACYLELGQSDKAIEHLLKAVELAPDSGDARFNLGTAYIRTRQIGEAISQLNEAVRLEPDSAEAVDRLGTAVALSGDRQGAYALFQRAIALDPDLANARNDIALLLIEQGDAAAALPHLEKLVELQPESPESHYRLSTAYQMTGNKEAAARHLRLGNQLRSEAAAAPQPAQ